MKIKKLTTLLSAVALTSIGVSTVAPNMMNNSVEAASSSAQQQAFVNQIIPIAKTVAIKYGTFPSVMMAQAMIEGDFGTSTLAAAPNYNQFGMKFKVGEDEGKYDIVYKNTQEWDGSKYVTVNAPFRKYPNIQASFEDNGKKLRQGPGAWNTSYYAGAWLENGLTYKDATAALQGKYATSPTYAQTLNNTISKWGLWKYDPEFSSMNGAMRTVTANAPTYNTFHGQKYENGSVTTGQTYNVGKVVKLPDGNTFYSIGNGKWVNAANMGNASTPSVPDNVGVINYVPGYGIAVWTQSLTKTTGQYLKHGTKWVINYKIKDSKGKYWFNVGYNAFVPAQYVKVNDISKIPNKDGSEDSSDSFSGIATINYVPGYGIAVWDGPKGSPLGKYLPHGTRWKVFEKAYAADGSVWYKVATNEWIPAQYVLI